MSERGSDVRGGIFPSRYDHIYGWKLLWPWSKSGIYCGRIIRSRLWV